MNMSDEWLSELKLYETMWKLILNKNGYAARLPGLSEETWTFLINEEEYEPV